MWQYKANDVRMKQLETDVTLHIGKHEAELALRVNSAAYYGDLFQLKSLIRAGADPKKKDYDGRTPLVCSLYEYVSLSFVFSLMSQPNLPHFVASAAVFSKTSVC